MANNESAPTLILTSLPRIIPPIQAELAGWKRPVVSDHELGFMVTTQLAKEQTPPTLPLYREVVDVLLSFGLILPDKDFPRDTVFHLFGQTRPAAGEVACAVDPFAYVSHLSAMEFHGLTDRFSKILYLTTPTDTEWRNQAAASMEKRLGLQFATYRDARLPLLRRLPAERIEGQRIELMRRSHRGAFKTIKSPPVRVATIGRTFLDMVREPGQCGGMQHVIETFRHNAARFLVLIVEEVQRHGNAIEKVRTGYLLDEICQLTHPLIDEWVQFAQRGGSRKLDPDADYAPYYSARWMLSVNVPSLQPRDPNDET